MKFVVFLVFVMVVFVGFLVWISNNIEERCERQGGTIVWLAQLSHVCIDDKTHTIITRY